MDHRKEHLIKKIQAIQDEDALARILHFVEEEALVYETALTPEQHAYVSQSCDNAIKESEEGKGIPIDDFLKSRGFR